jgi:hypothetical protein
VHGSVTAAGVKGTFGTITRSDGSTQATFDGHPLWHEITTSGTRSTRARQHFVTGLRRRRLRVLSQMVPV